MPQKITPRKLAEHEGRKAYIVRNGREHLFDGMHCGEIARFKKDFFSVSLPEHFIIKRIYGSYSAEGPFKTLVKKGDVIKLRLRDGSFRAYEVSN